MSRRWMLLSEARGAIGDAGEQELLTCLRRGELCARAEKFTMHWIHRKDPMYRSNGDSGYRMIAQAPTRMVPIAADWWDTCEADFANNTAHARWSNTELGQIGDSQPFKALVEGVIVQTADVERLWPHPPPPPSQNSRGGRRRGPEPVKLQQIMEDMRRFGVAKVRRMKEEAMAAQFGASRDTCRKAIKRLEQELQQSPTSDK
ncbi:hypothetical protein HU675_0037410 [Bradyrhizobium septentrionale]|uniref:hypothetical protein n=1 Tax=Bradyrhizobium septentrionale TaxID=1404411 RepID=UPI001596F1AF|nr:hypothetical protein [Bradyrhizobium septentrionale]UGY23576.1 hypothetical protein HU675_0037410 [Bradyrhizobium septentrionale]